MLACRRPHQHAARLFLARRAVFSGTFYGSLGEPGTTAWQAQQNIDIQRVTQTAIIHELTQQQIHTIETTVPWFLKNMPGSYFRQVPEAFRMDHLKAISAIKDANMDCRYMCVNVCCVYNCYPRGHSPTVFF